ncbi:MAG: phosphoribosyl-AMP cyclohydrolase [Syntrophorhabdaceae bacterium]|nr:phosphoribosyl-AMP cyclohydrolase [Syntrophorhabdaceae bacterium]MDD4195120.1 phosphoribosyl-AMP cyclohydrolase [Syntrophorhabdaceae bacterium]HOC46031.1 phosphoribosyl-AMP cyclohydrolase [Syntrophorhabdaceae bacterium]
MDGLKWDEKGLMPAVVQDANTMEVLMVAYMNNEALDLTIRTKKAHFYSRSRQKLWLKGESSGHTQEVKDIRIDCDNDTILLLVDQKVAACHTGYFSCFYRAWADEWKIVGKKVFNEKDVYGEKKTD